MKKMKTSTHNLMQEYEEKIRSARPGSTTKLRSTRFIFPATYRSSCQVLCKKGVPKYFAKFTGKHLCQSFFFNKVAGLSL